MTKAIQKVFICSHLFSHYEQAAAHQQKIWELVSEGVESGNMKATGRLLKTEEFNDTQDQDATGGGWVNGLKTSY